MTRIIQLYIPVPLAAEYRRRKEESVTSAQILRGFPAGGSQKVTTEVATLMMEDARRQGYDLAKRHGTAEIRTYRGIIKQIERRLREIQEAEQIRDSALALRQIIAAWRQNNEPT